MSFPIYQFGPSKTPRPLKYLILFTLFICIIAASTYIYFPHLQQLFELSFPNNHLWQFITYLFVHPLYGGISFSFLLGIAFNAYILWVIGASLIEKKGLAHFFTLYFTSGIVSGLAVYAIQSLTQSIEPFAGNGPAIYALLISWLYLYPQAELLLFMILPIRASWLILGVLFFNLLIDLSRGDWVRVVAYITASLFGYLYGKLLWRKKEETATPVYHRAKRFDFKTGKAILSDDEFLEAMLSKISLQGKQSLTWHERWRLRRISKKRKK